MSDKPLGPGWWLASDGTWHPPELHPINREDPSFPVVAEAPPGALGTTDTETELSELAELASMIDAEAAAPVAAVPSFEDAPTVTPVETIAPIAPEAPVAGSTPDEAVSASADDAPVATVEMPSLGPLAPRTVPSLPGYPKREAWSGESDHRADAGPMFPDLFQQAVNGSALANAITVNYADGEHREGLDVPQYSSPSAESQELVSAGGRMPAEVGAFTGASARKRRWRL
jgi:hypothetical protein